jgi:hypothetical protein
MGAICQQAVKTLTTPMGARLHDGLGNGVLEAQSLHCLDEALVQLGRPHQPRPLQRARLILIGIVCRNTAQNVRVQRQISPRNLVALMFNLID